MHPRVAGGVTSEPWVSEDAPRSPRFTERKLPLCPVCAKERPLGGSLCRRTLSSTDAPPGPWRCDQHGEVEPLWETYEVPVDDDEEDDR